MFKIYAVTNRNLTFCSLREQLIKICQSPYKPHAIILREKDLSESEYFLLAQEVQQICKKFGVQLIVHQFWEAGIKLRVHSLHVPLPVLRNISQQKEKTFFTQLGTSVHSLSELQEALELGVTYVIAGHIFATKCKGGVKPKGLDFLQQVCTQSKVPVYAIGGINFDGTQWRVLEKCGAQGACIMSAYMHLQEKALPLTNIETLRL